MNIEKYGFDRGSLVVSAAVNSCLKELSPEERRETLNGIVTGQKIDGQKLATLIDSAKSAAMVSTQAWTADVEDTVLQKSIDFIRSTLSSLDGKKYVKGMTVKFAEFIADCAVEYTL